MTSSILVGCTQQASSTSEVATLLAQASNRSDVGHYNYDSSAGLNRPHQVFDAGIIFADRTNNVAFPIDSRWLTSTAEIEAVSSSCDCAKVRFRDLIHAPDYRAQVAMDLEFEQAIRTDEGSQMTIEFEVRVRKSDHNEVRFQVRFDYVREAIP